MSLCSNLKINFSWMFTEESLKQTFFSKAYLFIWKLGWGGETIARAFPPLSHSPDVRQSQEPGRFIFAFHVGKMYEWQNSKHLDHLLLLFMGRIGNAKAGTQLGARRRCQCCRWWLYLPYTASSEVVVLNDFMNLKKKRLFKGVDKSND